MTWHDYRNRVSSHRGPDCAHGVFSLYPAGEFPVAHRSSRGDFQEGFPDLHLKRGALEVKRDVELPAPAGEVFVQLKRGVLEDSEIGLESPAVTGHRFILLAGEVRSGEKRTVRDEEDPSKGAIKCSISIHLVFLSGLSRGALRHRPARASTSLPLPAPWLDSFHSWLSSRRNPCGEKHRARREHALPRIERSRRQRPEGS